VSTFLVSLGVVGAAVVGVVLIALADPDQPATNHPPSHREGRHRRRVGALLIPPPSDPGTPSPSPAPGSEPATHRPVARVHTLPETPVREVPVPARRPVQERRRPAQERRRPARGWLRLRSGIALVVLVAFVGLVLAALVGASLALAAQALSRAVG
jgi:hypothetical protein